MCHVYAKSVCLAVLFCCVNISLLCVCHECAVCVEHCTLMTDTHKRDIYRTAQYCQSHTLSIVMTHTCDTSHTQCVCDVSQVCVMTMLSVCVSLVVVLSEFLSEYVACVSVMCVPCVTHSTLMTDTHKRYIHTTVEYCQAHS